MTNVKAIICMTFGAIGGMLARLFGGWTEDMVTLIVLMAVDFVMGLIIAGVFHNSNKSESGNLDSRAGWRGLSKKGVTLLFVLIAHRLDLSLGTNYIRTATIIGFILNETISVVENAGLMGMPLPDVIIEAINILKNKKETGFVEDK